MSNSVLSTPGAAFADLDQELASTRRILERFPDAKGDWGPHDKSRTIGQLAAHVANLPSLAAMILQTDYLDVMKRQPTPPATTAADLVAFFDGNVAMLKKAIDSATPDELDKSTECTWVDANIRLVKDILSPSTGLCIIRHGKFDCGRM